MKVLSGHCNSIDIDCSGNNVENSWWVNLYLVYTPKSFIRCRLSGQANWFRSNCPSTWFSSQKSFTFVRLFMKIQFKCRYTLDKHDLQGGDVGQDHSWETVIQSRTSFQLADWKRKRFRGKKVPWLIKIRWRLYNKMD